MTRTRVYRRTYANRRFSSMIIICLFESPVYFSRKVALTCLQTKTSVYMRVYAFVELVIGSWPAAGIAAINRASSLSLVYAVLTRT